MSAAACEDNDCLESFAEAAVTSCPCVALLQCVDGGGGGG